MSGPEFGQLLAVLSAVSFAAANLFVSRTARSGGDKGVMFSVLVTMAMSGLLWLTLEGGAVAVPGGGRSALGWFALAGVLAMVFGRSLLFESIRRLGVTRATAVKRLNPFFSAILAVAFLGEILSPRDLGGMAAIAAAFALLIHESFRARGPLAVSAPPPGAYLFGVFGAMAYAAAYISRKAGLELMPAPAFGTFVSAATGFAGLAAFSLASPRHRANFTGMLRNLDRWTVLAGVMVSSGQILLFAALAYERVSTVVMIASLEIFLSIFLAVVVFRTERMPGPAVALAAALAMAGVVLVAGG